MGHEPRDKDAGEGAGRGLLVFSAISDGTQS